MANLLRALLGGGPARANETVTGYSVSDLARWYSPGSRFVYGGREQQAYTQGSSNGGVVSSNSIVFTCQAKRVNVFSEARAQYQRMKNGRAGDLWGDATLSIFEAPWPGAGGMRDLLSRAEMDVACAGNSYWCRDPRPGTNWFLRLDYKFMNPMLEPVFDPNSGYLIGEQLAGYAYYTGGDKNKVSVFAPEEVAHYMPIPDPDRPWCGLSWLNPCLPDVNADQLITSHKLTTLGKGASIPYAVSFDAAMTIPEFRDFVEEYKREHEGPQNSGKPLFLAGGADVKTIGQTFEELALKATQGAGETRIAGCAGVPPVVAGLSEGMQGSSLNAGNYRAAKENFVDGTIRPNWGAFFGAFQSLMPSRSGSRLWYDDRDIPFLREDVTDQAEITAKDATSIMTLVNAGYEPDAAVDMVSAGDVQRLTGQHTGFVSVQLQPAGQTPPATNDGSGSTDPVTPTTGE